MWSILSETGREDLPKNSFNKIKSCIWTPSARFRKKCFQILFLVYMVYKSSIANKSTRGGFLFYVSTPKILSGLFFESRTWSPNERVGSKKLVGQFHIGRPFILPRTNEDCCASAQKNGRWQFVTGSEWMILYLKYIVLWKMTFLKNPGANFTWVDPSFFQGKMKIVVQKCEIGPRTFFGIQLLMEKQMNLVIFVKSMKI